MNLLHLEDDAFDLELTQLMCAGHWSDCEITPVRNRADFVSSLTYRNFDGIISDSGVAGLTGVEALELARQLAPGVPFMFLCGSVSPERREELLAARPDAIAAKDNPAEIRATFERLFRRS
jgi:CheY-like chemotaxis protein